MTDPERTEELAILLQETVEELKQQRELNQQLKSLIERNSQQLEAANASASASHRGSRSGPNTSTQTVVSLQTRNLVHSVYKEVTNADNPGWNFSQRFESTDNQQFLKTISQELNSLSPEASKEEISSACKTYFRSLKDDFRRKSKGVLEAHRKDLKVKKRLKQKLKQRQTMLSETARSLKWTSLKLSR